ncbi:MAG: 5'/3'-nucleotidase SurE [Muribaculaceae bacterium]|nr:5'/3'-nucleotidase SurE [Muribaculaceae bacterium]
MNNRPLILVSNDDSIYAKGVKELVSRLVKFGDVVAVCPDAPRSGQSMAITVNDPLRITPMPDFEGAKMYKASGTPVDCIKLAMHHILDRRPDLVVAGINHGSNASVNELYSGTMGATFEGCAFGIASVGFSLTSHDPDADFTQCYRAVDTIVDKVLKFGLPEGICLNVNIPNIGDTPEEMRICTPCRGHWDDEYKPYTDPAGRKFYLLSGEFINDEPDNELTDEWCLAHGIISVVPTSVARKVMIPDSMAWISSLPEEYQNC